VCPAKTGTLPIRLEGSTQVSRLHVVEVLDKVDFTIKFLGATKLNLPTQRGKLRVLLSKLREMGWSLLTMAFDSYINFRAIAIGKYSCCYL
jgi:hypothetical protein